MEIIATITSRSGRLLFQEIRATRARKIGAQLRPSPPFVYWREFDGPESVVIEIRDPGEGK